MNNKKITTRKNRIRAKLKKVSQRPRLTVFRSAAHIYCQIIDDNLGKTLVSGSDKDLLKEKIELKGKTKLEKSLLVGEILAKRALKKNVKRVYFDRGGYKYHGRVAAIAMGARKGGLVF